MAGSEIISIEMNMPGDDGIGPLEAFTTPTGDLAVADIRDRVRAWFSDTAAKSSFTCAIDGVEWGILAEPIRVDADSSVGALVIARQGRTWSKRERALLKTFADLLSHVSSLNVREGKLIHQQRLDELVSNVAVKLMSGSAQNRKELLDWTTRELAQFLGSDVAFMRRHDHARGLSIFEASWPVREDVPDPDPLGEVPYNADPIFEALWNLKEPYLTGVQDVTDEFVDRVERATDGLTPITGAAVPLMMGDITWGVIGFLYNEPQQWSQAEVNALQAVAAMVVHLQARTGPPEDLRRPAEPRQLTQRARGQTVAPAAARRVGE